MTKFLLDPGHGGVAFGHYFTPGKRSPEVPPGIYEGDFNRGLVNIVTTFTDINSVCNIASGPINIPLSSRVKYANKVWKATNGGCALISIHTNASSNKWDKRAYGFAVFTQNKPTAREKELAFICEKEFDTGTVLRSRGIRTPKQIGRGNFTILSRTNCPAVLIECGFMNNKEEVEFIQTPTGQLTIAASIINSMAAYSLKF